MANRVAGTLVKLFKLGPQRASGVAPRSVPPPSGGKEKPRKRALSDQEVTAPPRLPR